MTMAGGERLGKEDLGGQLHAVLAGDHNVAQGIDPILYLGEKGVVKAGQGRDGLIACQHGDL